MLFRISIGVIWLATGALAQTAVVPLFIIERSLNTNIVHYDARLKNGRLDPAEPVVAYWEMKAEDGRRRDLNVIERLKAYGFSIRPDAAQDSYILTMVSDKRRRMEIYIRRMGERVRAEVTLGNCRAYLERIYVTAHTAMLLPVADSVELIGKEIMTGAPCRAKIADN